MHIDPGIVIAALVVGFVVGLTGMGGGALMTPILVLFFKVQPLAAVSSDLVASLFMRPLGAAIHWRKGTVNTEIVKWLMVGSVPSAFAGVIILKLATNAASVQMFVKTALGVALVLAAVAMLLRGFLKLRATEDDGESFKVHALPTVVIGAVGGFVVGMTSVGSGSLIIVMLMLLYRSMRGRALVGTDLTQAIPLVAAAALGHVLFGDFKLSLTASLLIGSVPGVVLGAMASSRAPDMVIRPALFLVLIATGLKLLNLSNLELAIGLVLVILVAAPVWGATDAAAWSKERWASIGRDQRRWVAIQAFGLLAGVGPIMTIAYLFIARPQLEAALQKAQLS